MKRQPKYTKYKKYHKGNLSKFEFKSNRLNFGTIGLKAIESGTINYKQIEAARQAASRKIKRKGKIWIRVFTDLPITSKSTGARMGKGKGSISDWIVKVRGGTMLFEICGGMLVTDIDDGLKAAGTKLPIKTKVVK